MRQNEYCKTVVRIATLTAGASTPAKETLENIVVSAFMQVRFPNFIPLHYINPLALPAAIKVIVFAHVPLSP